MSVAQQAIRARRKSKLDPRYKGWMKDASKRQARMLRTIANEKARQGRKSAKKG